MALEASLLNRTAQLMKIEVDSADTLVRIIGKLKLLRDLLYDREEDELWDESSVLWRKYVQDFLVI